MIKRLPITALLAGLTYSLMGCLDGQSGQALAGAEEASKAAAKVAGTGWTSVGFSAYDVSIGSDGTVLRLAMPDVGGGNHEVQKWLGAGSFTNLGGSAQQLSGPSGTQVMTIKADKSLWQHVSGTWTPMGGANDITAKLNVYRLNTTAAPTGGYTISKRNGSSWNVINGSGHRLAVAPNGDLWALNHTQGHSIWRLPAGSTQWVQVLGYASEIAITFDGTVYVLGQIEIAGGLRIYRYLPASNSWQGTNGAGVKIAGGVGKSVWVVSNDNTVWYSENPPNE